MRLVYASIPLCLAALSAIGFAQSAESMSGPYRVLNVTKVGGDGGFDYVYADSVGRRLYICRIGQTAKVAVFDLDTLQPAGEILNTSGHGAAVDPRSHHGFASSRPIAMWDSRTMTPIKTIDVDGGPDGILGDPFNHRIWVFSHRAPNATVIDAASGTVVGTVDLGGAPEQAQSDGHGRIYVDIEDKAQVAVVDAAALKVTATYSLNGKGEGCAGLGLDSRNHVLFVACRNPNVMVMLDANTGNYLADLPIGQGCDGVVFNPKTHECFSSQGDGTLTVIKETGSAKFMVEETVQTMMGAKTCTLDTKTGHVLLIAAEYAPPPSASSSDNGGGQRRRRGPMIPGSFSVVVVGKA